jgi:hypothetical protein
MLLNTLFIKVANAPHKKKQKVDGLMSLAGFLLVHDVDGCVPLCVWLACNYML